MRRILPFAGAALFAAALLTLGWSRWPRDAAAPPSSAVVEDPTTTRITPTTTPTTATPSTLNGLADPEIVPFPLTARGAQPMQWHGSLVAVSAREAWATLAPVDGDPLTIIGHLEDGRWTAYRLTAGDGWAAGLGRGLDGTLWAATDGGVFSFDGADWARRFDEPATGVTVADDGTVWIGGRRDSWYDEPIRLWLARGSGASWERVDPAPDDSPVAYGSTLLALGRGGSVWMVQRAGNWAEDDLMHYDGSTLQAVQIPGVPDSTPQNGIPAMRPTSLTAGPDGDVWVVGYLAARPEQALVARFDGTTWIVYDWPPADPPGPTPLINAAVGPDGVAWFAFDGGLRSFDGTTWTAYLGGRAAYSVDVAPDGTVWYTDAAGAHVLELP